MNRATPTVPGPRARVFRFNMIEIALALVILAVGLSSVLVLFPIGANASNSSVADNNLANVAEQVMAYLQSELTAPANWTKNGESKNVSIGEFDSDPENADTAIPKTDAFGADDKVANMDGLLKKTIGGQTYYLYRQYADIGGADDSTRVVDFEAMIRAGTESGTSLSNQFYPNLEEGNVKTLSNADTYNRKYTDSPEHTQLKGAINDLLPKFYKSVIVEFSWPADAPWSKREKRIFRMELFNENFVPYPQTAPTP